jgi:hypothetical protein
MSTTDHPDNASRKGNLLDRRNLLLAGTTLAAASALPTASPLQFAKAQAQQATSETGRTSLSSSVTTSARPI